MAFGICWRYDNRPEIQNQWEFVLSNFGVTADRAWVRGAPPDWRSYLDAPKIEKVDEIAGDRSFVLLAHPEAKLPGLISLVNFVHPADAVYIFGADNVILTAKDDLGSAVLEDRVYIPTVQHESYSYVAAAMTLYDRLAKGG